MTPANATARPAKRTVEASLEPAPMGDEYTVHFSSEALPGTLAVFAGVLALEGLDIGSAVVRKTLDGRVHDSFEIRAVDGGALSPDTANRLAVQAMSALNGGMDLAARLRAVRGGLSAKRSDVETLVEIETGSEFSTGVKVRTADRVGLLHDLAAALTAHGMRTRSLTVLTFDGRAHDTFRIVDANGAAPVSPVELEALSTALVAAATV